MFHNELFQKIAQNAPLAFMARGLLENVLSPQKLEAIFQKNNSTQRTRQILFPFVVELMLLVACKIRPSIHSTYNGAVPK